MPHYFFNTRIAGDTIADPDGQELRDPDHAWEVARAIILDILEDEGEHPRLLAASLLVTDRNGDIVLEFPFSEALIEQDAPATWH